MKNKYIIDYFTNKERQYKSKLNKLRFIGYKSNNYEEYYIFNYKNRDVINRFKPIITNNDIK